MIKPSSEKTETEDEKLERFKVMKADLMRKSEDELRTYPPFYSQATGAKAEKGNEPARDRPEMVRVILWKIFTRPFTDKWFDRV